MFNWARSIMKQYLSWFLDSFPASNPPQTDPQPTDPPTMSDEDGGYEEWQYNPPAGHPYCQNCLRRYSEYYCTERDLCFSKKITPPFMIYFVINLFIRNVFI